MRLTDQVARVWQLIPTNWVKDLPLAALADLLESIADAIKATYTLPELKRGSENTLGSAWNC